MRRTKIIATLGPATDDPDVLRQLLIAGTDVVRINLSHGDWDAHQRRINLVREVAAREGRSVGIIGDLQGPKVRIRGFRDGSVILTEGQDFTLDSSLGAEDGDSIGVGVAYKNLVADVGVGDVLLLDDGQIVLDVIKIQGTRIQCRVSVGGKLSSRKGINLQGGGLSAPALTETDLEDIRRAAEAGLDWLAVSFVREAQDLVTARKILRGAKGKGHIIAKIERSEAMANLESIIDASDAVMVARGDLGVEMGYAVLAGLQKRIIRLTRDRHKVVITATQMMESMIQAQMPTRAEVSDVANAVMDGTDAVMLSAETAIGEYPVKAVAAMAEVCVGTESYHQATARMSRHRMDDQFRGVDEAIAMAVMYTANHLDVEAIIALTESGNTARWMSRIRSDIPIYAFTRQEVTQRRVSLYRGVYPVAFDITHTDPVMIFQDLFRVLLDRGDVKEGDLVIVTKGDLEGVQGGTNGMKILRVTSQ
jgi:pyruvate kinase